MKPVWAVSPVVQKILLVNFVLDPLLFFPSFYTVKEALASPQLDAAETVRGALGNYAKNWKQDLRNTWMVWFPGHAVSFGLMPPHLRMPWVAGLSFAYLTVLSFTRGETTESCAAARLPAARLQMRAGD